LKAFFRIVLLLVGTTSACASGHGPVFGYATPTNSQGEWSSDLSLAGRNVAEGNQLTARGMIGYGFTPHLTFSFSAPLLLVNDALPPTRLQAGDDFDGTIAWRFHHRASKVGTRFESTAFGGVMVPGPQVGSSLIGTLKRAPGFSGGVVTGMASRSSYIWVGSAFARYMERDGDQRPNVFTYSVVYGYRPEAWRKESDKWDWRLFAEMSGEISTRASASGVNIRGTEANQLFVGPSMLGIKRNYAVSFGAQFPIYRDVGTLQPKERFRAVLNVSYFLFQHQH
jgi:hypothetical protein